MTRTRHFQHRMSKRGIRLDLVELVREFGELDGDKVVLGRKGLCDLLAGLREIEQKALKAMDKGGLVVVEDGRALITTYPADSYDRRRARQCRRGRRGPR